MTEPERVDLAIPSEAERRIEALRDLLPEAFSEGVPDLARIGEILGIGPGPEERYGLSWAGKADALSALRTGSSATLRPDEDASIGFDQAKNVLIEGDNLEVLRLLQRGYNDKINLIYIDPPYNTGKDFVYSDDFRDGLGAYLELTGQVAADGTRLSSNSETSGRYHSAWLTFMYPRLAFARNLLAQEGVILVSIDEHEVHNLRLLMDEVFGAENFIAELVWEKTRKNDATFFSVGHEYMLVWGRNKEFLKNSGPKWREERPGAREILDKVAVLRAAHGGDDATVQVELRAWFASLPKTHPSKALSRYKNIDEHGPWRDRDISWPGGGGPRYDVIHPTTGEPCEVPPDGWRFASPETMAEQISLGLVEFREDHTKPPFRKAYLIPRPDESEVLLEDDVADQSDEDDDQLVGLQVMPSVLSKQAQVAAKHLRALMGAKVFESPKDHEVLARLINYCTRGNKSAVVLDFFAGSGSTGEAVLSLNATDGGDRRFIGVQWPEQTPEKSVARREGYETVFDVCLERIRRVITGTEDASGLRVLRLRRSNFKVWDPASAPADGDGLALHLNLFADSLADDATDDGILIEVLLKEGISLNAPLTRHEIAGEQVVKVAKAALTVCLARKVADDLVSGLIALGSPRVVMLETAFAGDDAVKSNAFYRLRDASITLRTV
ncbi:site-specific DNA-methyltransferase [Modestobacter versicolor]|uniref:site-specific DNA-methyltransferase n=1 Tax=Modestobacter versicolor TaxID=429133 RepID=UPI0034DF874E